MNKRNRVILGMVGALVLGSGIFCSNVLAENPQESEFSVTIAPSATLTIPSAPINLIVEPTAEGQFASGSFNITAYTNSPEGFTVTMATSSTALVSDTVSVTTGDPYTIPTLAASTTQANFTPNRWGISLDGGTTYIPMPSSDTIIDEDEETGASGYTQSIRYATKLDFGTVPGTYSTTINFTATANITEPSDYTNGGGGNQGSCHDGGVVGDSTGSGTCDTGSGNGAYFPANSLLRAFEVAYVYNHKPIYVADDATNTSWHLMQDGETVGGGKQVRFAMQDIDMKFVENNVEYSVCDYAAQSNRSATPAYTDEALVMDLRDGKSYWIAKLEDGKCWMTSNLDHNIVSTTDYYDDVGTDLGWTNGAYQTATTWNSTTGTYPTPTVHKTGVATLQPGGNTGTWQDHSPVSVDVGEWYQLFDGTNSTECDYLSESCPTLFINTRNGNWAMIHRNVGNLYNWSAASFNLAQTYDTATESICPRGWTLPSTGDNNNAYVDGDYNVLYGVYGSQITEAPVYLSYAGSASWKTHMPYNAGVEGDYWQTEQNSDEAYYIYVSSGSVEPIYKDGKGNLWSVRCIAR